MMRAMYSPSKFWLAITTMPRFLQNHVAGKISQCQKANIKLFFNFFAASWFSHPITSHRRLGPITSTAKYPSKLAKEICTRSQSVKVRGPSGALVCVEGGAAGSALWVGVMSSSGIVHIMPGSHSFVMRPAAPFRADPGDDFIGVGDVAGFAVDAV